MPAAVDRLLPILPVTEKPLIILCRGAYAAFSGYRDRHGTWRDESKSMIHNLIVGWEYQDGTARGRYKGSKIIGLYLILREKQARVQRLLIVK